MTEPMDESLRDDDEGRTASAVLPVVRMMTVELTLVAEEPGALPAWPTTTFRGALGTALRHRVCVTGYETCGGCPQILHCSYGLLWHPPMPADVRIPRRAESPPKPYVIEAAGAGRPRSVARGDRLALRLKLFGDVRNHVPHFIMAARDAAAGGLGARLLRFALVAASSVDRDGHAVRLWTERDGFHRYNELQQILVAQWPHVPGRNRVRLSLETPLALKHEGVVASRFHPDVFTARLGERLDLLSLYFEGRETVWDFMALRALSREARVIHHDVRPDSFTRDAARQSRRVPMEGLVGELVLEDVHPRVLSLWRCAEHIHVGKNAAFGFGKVRVEVLYP